MVVPKFRFWYREKGCFVDDSLYLDSLGNVYRDVTVDFFGPKAIENPIRPLEYIEVMQSTGLFDKNGKEIFEGDVVNIFGEKLSQIYYSEGAFCVEVLNGGTPLHVYLSEHLEIIGNIYENPELVEGLNEK
ncbi:hypothetical protein HO918_10875 [Streptococcus suis]|uniref:Phage protein n=1 Tax=Streptococcus suis TaxID=1307 RepID=A0AAN2UTC6_STRSU|nr:YopX family protein [Streptococcus suis]NQH73534.1 hypothetical protein [Streptococcus suis]NQP43443.1 hypothetical protein [Streptococcus suis]NQP45463.1 hypothetical protein [Streptococcus suis]CYU74301.1 phage protein [Streptococcus suis]